MLEFLLPDASKLHLNSLDFHDKQILLKINVIQSYACCPNCHTASIRVNSHYFRTIMDLPSAGFRVIIQLDIRRFFCDLETCSKQTFTERIPNVVEHYARKTIRLVKAQSRLGFVIGGEAGSRISADLSLATSPDSLLRTVRAYPEPQATQVNHLGVDDWAFRKGQSYGTILVNLDNRRPFDLLPDRSAESLTKWLTTHPEIEVVSRDRFNSYKEGITLGAPQAVQVADRFHLLHNLADTVERILSKRYQDIKEVNRKTNTTSAQIMIQNQGTPEIVPVIPIVTTPTAYERQRQISREKHQDQFEEVKRLHAEGLGIREIQRKLHFSRERIRRYLSNDELPIYQRRKRETVLNPFWSYVQQRWESGCRKGIRIWEEVKANGYTGSYQSFARLIRPLRQSLPSNPKKVKKSGAKEKQTPARPLSTKQVTWLMVKIPDKLDEEQFRYLKTLREHSQEFQLLYTLAQEFGSIVRQRKKIDLPDWLTQAKQSGISEMKNFALGLEKDLSAVEAALTFSWSNGPVEGHNNRLKMIKRQMYGRAKFDLLRLRVLYA